MPMAATGTGARNRGRRKQEKEKRSQNADLGEEGGSQKRAARGKRKQQTAGRPRATGGGKAGAERERLQGLKGCGCQGPGHVRPVANTDLSKGVCSAQAPDGEQFCGGCQSDVYTVTGDAPCECECQGCKPGVSGDRRTGKTAVPKRGTPTGSAVKRAVGKNGTRPREEQDQNEDFDTGD